MIFKYFEQAISYLQITDGADQMHRRKELHSGICPFSNTRDTEKRSKSTHHQQRGDVQDHHTMDLQYESENR
jgi:hypothetical protein